MRGDWPGAAPAGTLAHPDGTISAASAGILHRDRTPRHSLDERTMPWTREASPSTSRTCWRTLPGCGASPSAWRGTTPPRMTSSRRPGSGRSRRAPRTEACPGGGCSRCFGSSPAARPGPWGRPRRPGGDPHPGIPGSGGERVRRGSGDPLAIGALDRRRPPRDQEDRPSQSPPPSSCSPSPDPPAAGQALGAPSLQGAIGEVEIAGGETTTLDYRVE